MYAFSLILLLLFIYAAWHNRTVRVNIRPLTQPKSMAARGVLALMIVFHHYGTELSLPPTQLFYPIGAMAVGVFFLMSGYGLSYSYAHRGDDYLLHFLRKRLLKIILPFILAILAWQVEEICLYGIDDLPNRWSMLTQGLTRGWLPFSWYVWVALYYYVVFYLVYHFIRSPRFRWVALFVGWGLQVALANVVLRWDDYWYISSHLFVLGMLYQRFEPQLQRINAFVWMGVMAVLAQLIRIDWHFSEVFFNTAFALLFVCGITLVEVRSKIFNFLGKISYEIYLVQGFGLFALKETAVPVAIKALIALIINVVLAYGLHFVVEKLHSRFSLFRV